MGERFGSQGSYLVDFYHVCDYLSAAAEAIYPETEAAKAWFSKQKERLKAGCYAEVIELIAPLAACSLDAQPAC